MLLGKVERSERALKADWLSCLQGAWKAGAGRSYINSFVHDISVCRRGSAAALKEGLSTQPGFSALCYFEQSNSPKI